MGNKIGIDVGGTFTDFLLIDEDGKTEVYKVLTTPYDPSEGVFEGLNNMAENHSLSLKEFLENVDLIVHGTTITTNAVITGEGAKTGFITTKGFRDCLNLRRGMRKDQYNPKQSPPSPIVPRHLVIPVEERIDVDGKEVTPLNKEDVLQAVELLEKSGVESVGVSFLFSFFNPSHEKEVKNTLLERLPNLYISLSSEVLPQVRVYERNSTTALNAYVAPVLSRYLKSLQERLHEHNFRGVLLIMQSNGGVMSPEFAMRFAVNTLMSGPAGGPVAGLFYTSNHGLNNLITIDMGGTSFDVSMVYDGAPTITKENEISGHFVGVPMIDIHSIGAGGGSIAWIDAGGILRVGPKSAGADPGPICYGKGGEEPTVTDSNLLLGYLDREYFFGGRIKLDVEKTEKLMKERIADPLGLSVEESSYGVYRVVNSNMADAIRVVTVQRGYDPREFALVVAGGAGPLHAGMIAEELEIPLIIIPRESSVFCATGMLISDLRHDYVRTYSAGIENIHLDTINDLFSEMRASGIKTLKQEGINEKDIQINYSVDMRYVGQFNEVEVPITVESRMSSETLQEMVDRFHELHDTLYGYSMAGAPVETINLRVSALGKTTKPQFQTMAYGGEDPSEALKSTREVFLEGERIEVRVYDGLKLTNGNLIEGPGIIEQPTTTILVPSSYDLMCDSYGNYVLYPKGEDIKDLIERFRG
jgi:N-methylhydantoinase A